MFSLYHTCDVVMYFDGILSRNGEESLNKLLSPDRDPDHRRGPRHGYNTSSVKIIKSIGAIFFE